LTAYTTTFTEVLQYLIWLPLDSRMTAKRNVATMPDSVLRIYLTGIPFRLGFELHEEFFPSYIPNTVLFNLAQQANTKEHAMQAWADYTAAFMLKYDEMLFLPQKAYPYNKRLLHTVQYWPKALGGNSEPIPYDFPEWWTKYTYVSKASGLLVHRSDPDAMGEDGRMESIVKSKTRYVSKTLGEPYRPSKRPIGYVQRNQLNNVEEEDLESLVEQMECYELGADTEEQQEEQPMDEVLNWLADDELTNAEYDEEEGEGALVSLQNMVARRDPRFFKRPPQQASPPKRQPPPRPTARLSAIATDSRETRHKQPCRVQALFPSTGVKCEYGDKCRYSHEQADLNWYREIYIQKLQGALKAGQPRLA
jgi:hypothetical protein